MRYPVFGRNEIDGLRSSRFKAWLAAKYFDAMQEEPKQADIEGALLLLAVTAEFSPPRKLHTRIGTVGGKIYLDLCNEERQAVEIDADGWRVVDEPPLWFLRGSMKALPAPQPGGSLMDLREFINASDEDFVPLGLGLASPGSPRSPSILAPHAPDSRSPVGGDLPTRRLGLALSICLALVDGYILNRNSC